MFFARRASAYEKAWTLSVSYTHLNSEIAYWLSRAYSGEIETLNLETGDIADYRTTAQGMELEVLDAEEKRLAVLYFRWDEVAPLLRGMYALSLIHIYRVLSDHYYLLKKWEADRSPRTPEEEPHPRFVEDVYKRQPIPTLPFGT